MPPATPAGDSPHLSSSDRVLDDVFLTPRVLDESAFTGYAESLRALIRDADTRSARLASTTTETEQLCETIREAARRLDARTTQSAKLAKELDARAKRAQTVVDRLASAVTDNAELQKLAAQIIAHRKAEIESRVNTAVDDLAESVKAAEAHAAKAHARLAQAETRAAEAEARAAAAEQRAEAAQQAAGRAAEDAEKRLAALEQRIATLTLAADRTTERAEAAHEQLDQSASAAVARIKSAAAAALDHAERDADAIRAAAAQAIEQSERRADAATSNALEAIEQLRVLADDLDTTLAGRAEQLRETARPIEELAERAHALLSDDGAAGSIKATIARAEQIAERLDAALPDTETELTRLDAARRQLSESIDAAATAIDEIDRRRAEVCATAEQDIEAIAEDLSPVEHAANGLRKRIEDYESRLAALVGRTEPSTPAGTTDEALVTLRAQTDEITASALQRIEEAGMWLVTLIRRAEQLDASSSADDEG